MDFFSKNSISSNQYNLNAESIQTQNHFENDLIGQNRMIISGVMKVDSVQIKKKNSNYASKIFRKIQFLEINII